MAREEPADVVAEAVAAIGTADTAAAAAARDLQDRLTKPPGALGVLEEVSVQLAGLAGACPPPTPEPAAVAVFAADHGVHAQDVTPWPQEVTGQMVANVLAGGAAVNVFAAELGAEVRVTEIGLVRDVPAPELLARKVRAGTGDMTAGPAMTREEARRGVQVGIEVAYELVASGHRVLLTGDMGIANTTAAAALVAAFTGRGPAEVTGRGAGDDAAHARKVQAVLRALDRNRPDPADPLGALAAVGGLEHAGLAGLILGGAARRVPVVLDGVTAGAAALVAIALTPDAVIACLAGHRSTEPGHAAALADLRLRPLVDLELRLGEGTGALLALPVVRCAARTLHDMATFDSAGVTDKGGAYETVASPDRSGTGHR